MTDDNDVLNAVTALRLIHSLANEALRDYENGNGDKLCVLLKEIRYAAGKAYPPLEPHGGGRRNCSEMEPE